MDASVSQSTIPVVVDLDGTLILGDLFWESIFQLLRRSPWLIVMLPLWALMGKARLKYEIAERVDLDAQAQLYRKEVLGLLASARGEGRPIVLATGSPKRFALAIARHLGFFDRVLSSTKTVNLTASRKAGELQMLYGTGGFDYIGNSADDIAIFEVARNAVVVASDKKARRWQFSHDADLIEPDKWTWRTVLRMLRVHQWLKNVLIFVPLVLDHKLGEATLVRDALIAFVAYSATASAIYILNDFFDLPLDRRHPRKRTRPFASGQLQIPFGIWSMAGLLLVAIVCASMLNPLFQLVLAGYMVMTTAYSVSLKRMLLIDVFVLAGLYAMRILAGTVAIGAEPSFWLLAFSIFFFMSLALAKRYVELDQTGVQEGERIAGRAYRAEDKPILSTAGIGAGSTAALVLALYINSPDVYRNYFYAWMIWPLAPIILYIILRIWVLAGRGELDDDPVVFIISDWRSQLMIALGSALLLAAAIRW